MTLTLDKDYWSKRYRNGETGWDLGGVSRPLKEYFDQLTDKNISILIPGAGNGYEAEYLLNNGFQNVYVCDYAEEPLVSLKKRVPQLKESGLLKFDFFELPFENHFDLIIEQTFFCAIDPSLRRKYFEKMNSLLKPQGKLVGVLFNDVLNKDQPPFGGSKAEYSEYFKDLFQINVYETCHNSIKPRENRELFINLKKMSG